MRIKERSLLLLLLLLHRSDRPHFRFSRLHQNPLDNEREDDPFTFSNFTMEGVP